jgi:chromosome segregation ATPase
MQLFSIGNLITFLAVLLILVILRALDRNNRSLEKLKRFSDKIGANISALAQEKAAQIGEITAGLQASLATGKDLMTRARAVDEALQTRAAEVEGVRKRLLDYEKGFSEIASVSSRLDQTLKKLRAEAEAADSVGKRIGETAARIEKLEKKLPEIEAQSNARARQALESFRAEITASVETKVGTLVASVNASEKRLKDFSSYMARLEARGDQAEKERAAYLSRSLEAFDAELNSRLARAHERSETLEDEVFSRLAAKIKDDEAALARSIQAMETQLADYQGDMDYRVKSLEESGNLDALRTSLEESIQKMAAGARSEMKQMAAGLVADWQAETAAATSARDELHAGLEEVHSGLKELKTRAYQDVEKGLSVFEDEFFADLRERAAQALDRYQGWQKDMEKRMDGFEAELKSRLSESDETLQGVRDALRAEVEKARKDSSLALEKETSNLGEALDGAVRKTQREMEMRLHELSVDLDASRKEMGEVLSASRAEALAWEGRARQQLSETEISVAEKISLLAAEAQSSIGVVREEFTSQKDEMLAVFSQEKTAFKAELEANRKEISQLLEASSTYVTAWEAKTRQRLTESQAALAKKLASLESQTGASVAAFKEEFTAQREELVATSREESAAFKTELAEIEQRISALKADLTASSGETLEKLLTQAQALEMESQKRMRDFQEDVEARIKEYRQLLAESREKAEGMQEKLFAKIDESYRSLSMSLADIDKRVKSFTAQTRLFERGDSLKAALEVSIEEMKKEISKLGADRAELAETELQLAKTKKLADETATKLSRFIAEKRRIDEMEGEFKRLLALSRDIDLKVNTLSGSHDALQQIQAKVREFEEMGKVVETGVERLDKKQQIITVTSEGVDKNFQRLENIEKTLKTTDQEAAALEEKVRSLASEYETLAGRRKDAETVVEISGKLTSVIEDLESRLEKAQNSREWLARTETRFEEIGRQAQEQVRLLESIVKSESRKEKGERGAPPLDKRETVVKLSHQGWSVQEISRVTQLSRGEVELILEIAPKV